MSGLSLGRVVVYVPNQDSFDISDQVHPRVAHRGSSILPFWLSRAPIFVLGVTVLDLLGRLLIIERKDVLLCEAEVETVASASVQTKNEHEHSTAEAKLAHGDHHLPQSAADGIRAKTPHSLSFLSVVCKLSRSSRALAVLAITFVHGTTLLIYSNVHF